MDRDQRNVYRRMLTAAFLDDLARLRFQVQANLVFIFDALNEDVNADVKDWVSAFINLARNHPWLVVVVAGQVFPRLAFDDPAAYYRHELEPFKIQDLYEFAREAGLDLKPEFLELLNEGTKGQPLTLSTILGNLQRGARNE
jgi:hypothetical protein